MLDRMAVLMPRWRERNAADLGVALVEMLAYVGDHLSYQQDAVATEAYLGTARRRVSVRRHARLVDYRDARRLQRARLGAGAGRIRRALNRAAGTQLFTRIPGEPPALPDDPACARRRRRSSRPMEAIGLFEAHNKIQFYTWSDQRCCLPKGATHATCANLRPDLKAGDVLIFEEVISPRTGRSEDADPRIAAPCGSPTWRRARRNQPLTDRLDRPEISEIFWGDEDALPFPFWSRRRPTRPMAGSSSTT